MKKKGSAGLEAISKLEDKPSATAGEKASKLAQTKNEKTKSEFVGVRMSKTESDKLKKLSRLLEDEHGIQPSKGNALRMALYFCDPTSEQLKEFAQVIKNEDGRKEKS